MIEKKINETYLGDGLYAFFDGEMIHLRTKRLDGDHSVVLAKEVLDSFFRFVEKSMSINIIISKRESYD